jgi:large subunit ribosomal protein L15
MKLSDIRPARGAVKRRKRVGCGPGSGRGKTATRGHKGQKSRSGGGTPPWFEGGQMPLQRRVPKRGFTNIFKVPYQIVNIDRLNGFDAGTKINRETLLEAGLVRKASRPVKILGRGELSVALDVEVDAVSGSAEKAILGAGGSVRLVTGARTADTGSEPAAPAPRTVEEPPAAAEESPPPAVEDADASEEERQE